MVAYWGDLLVSGLLAAVSVASVCGQVFSRGILVPPGTQNNSQMKGFKEFFPGVPTMVPYWFAVPNGVVSREGVALEQHVRRESGEHVVGDRKLGAHRFFLGLLHVDNELGHKWVVLPQFLEAEDEFYPRGLVQARDVLLEVVEDCSNRDVGVKRPGDAQLLDPCRFDIGQNEVSRTYLNCAYAALVCHTGCPAVFHPTHFLETVVLRKSFDVRVIIGARVPHEIEGSPVVRLVDGIGEDHAGGAAGGCTNEGDAKGAHDERLVELLQVGIVRLRRDGAERFARLLEDNGDVGQFGHDEGGAERAALGPFNVA